MFLALLFRTWFACVVLFVFSYCVFLYIVYTAKKTRRLIGREATTQRRKRGRKKEGRYQAEKGSIGQLARKDVQKRSDKPLALVARHLPLLRLTIIGCPALGI